MYLGDFAEDGDLFFKFTTRAFATGIPTTLAGSPVLSVYKDEGGAATEKTTAEAYFDLDVDHDSIAGWNNVRIDLSGDAFFATGADYSIVITTGTVDSVDVFGENIANFSIENRSMGQPAGATLAADIAALKAETVLILADTDDIGVAGAGLTALGGMSTTMKGQVNTEVDGSMVTYGLDHLVAAAVTGTDVTDDSIIAFLVDDAVTADWDNYDNTTASLEALNVDTDAIKAETALIVADTDVIDDGTSGLVKIASDVAAILADTGTDGVVLAADAITAAKIADNAIATEHIATGAITADSIAADAIGASELATDAVTEIVSGVWDRDATSNQTAGTFGEALGDPAATGESIRQLVGELNAAAAAGDPSTTESVMQYVKQIVNVLVGSAGVVTYPAAADPANGVSIAEVLRRVFDDTDPMTYSKANELDVNTKSINDAEVVGDGNAIPWDGA